MSGTERFSRALKALNNFLMFFLLIAFVITCCLMLFIYTMIHTMGISLTAEHISTAAKATFANVILLSLLATVIDWVRREVTVERPARRITQAAENIMEGDFSVRIPVKRSLLADDKMQQIALCFNNMAQELQGVETLRTDFIANVSHELKTPLSVIHNYASLLAQPDIKEQERVEYAGIIARTSRQLAGLVTNILKLNKLENQQISPQFHRYDLSEQVCQCLLGYEEQWEKKQLQIETDIADGVTVSSDEEMMQLVWNNLLSNAMKFTQPGGTVRVSVKEEGTFAVVSISDTGCGISQEVGQRMFDKFYQGDTSHASQGNGLGLALVKRVVDMTQSEISVESQLGKGSTFTVKMRRDA